MFSSIDRVAYIYRGRIEIGRAVIGGVGDFSGSHAYAAHRVAAIPQGVFVALRCALKMPIRLATSLGRNEARWRNEKGSAIGIASATALRIFF
jgi:hypothetical protein